jgi:8-oxo-dGTP pyrophosphatase MutT (NUDIX family)
MLFCTKGCCKIYQRVGDAPAFTYDERHFTISSRKKAGVILINTVDRKILIVQCYSNLWGVPKGSLEQGETEKQCALRELLEETGIRLDESSLKQPIRLGNCNACYFPVLVDRSVIADLSVIDQEITAIGWVHLDCLVDMVQKKLLPLNYHFRQLLETIETIFKHLD